jgi:hypothetical protein
VVTIATIEESFGVVGFKADRFGVVGYGFVVLVQVEVSVASSVEGIRVIGF